MLDCKSCKQSLIKPTSDHNYNHSADYSKFIDFKNNGETISTNLTVTQSDKNDSDDDFLYYSICNDNDFTSTSESESRNSNLANLQALSF